MGRTVSSLFEHIDELGADCRQWRLMGMSLVVSDDEGESPSIEWVKPIVRVDVDEEEEEILLFVDEGSDGIGSTSISELLAILTAAHSLFSLCLAEDHELDDTHIRLDTPLWGLGENPERGQLFVVVKAT